MDEKEIRLELKMLVNIDFKQKEHEEIEYPHLKKLVSKLIKNDDKIIKTAAKHEGYIIS
jgi:hypothetical protein